MATAAVLAATIALGVFAPGASAHNVNVRPDADFIGSTFTFRGTAWQPFQTVRWYYDEFANGSFNQTGRFTVSRSGNFSFRWTSNDTPGTHRLCFKQYDSRQRFRRYFTACDRYETFLFDR